MYSFPGFNCPASGTKRMVLEFIQYVFPLIEGENEKNFSCVSAFNSTAGNSCANSISMYESGEILPYVNATMYRANSGSILFESCLQDTNTAKIIMQINAT